MKRSKKWILLIISVILYAIFGSMVSSVQISDMSMVILIGVDVGEEKSFHVSASILIANTEGQSASYATRVVEIESDTLTQGLNEISRLSGKPVSLAQCNNVVLGEDIVKAGLSYVSLSYLVGNSYLSDDAGLFMSRGKASEFLGISVAFENSPSAYLRNIVMLRTQYNNIISKSVQEFFIAYHQKGYINYLPIIDTIETNNAQGTSIQSSGSEKKDYMFNLTSCAIIRRNDYVCEIAENETLAINLICNKIDSGNITSKGENQVDITLFVVGKKDSAKFDTDNNTVSVKIKINTILKEISDYENTGTYVDRDVLTDSEVENINKEVEQNLLTFYKKAQELDIDVFSFTQSFFARTGKDIKLSDITLKVDVQIEWT